MYALVVLALFSTSPPAERWIPFTPNPAWELYGREDASGVFRYTQTRQKPTASPVLNYGVSLPPLTASSPAHDLRGTDPDTSAMLVREALDVGPSSATVADGEVDVGALCEHGDCPNGRCDRRKPPPVVEDLAWLEQVGHLKKIAGAALGVVILGVFLLFAVALFVVLWRVFVNLFSPPESPHP